MSKAIVRYILYWPVNIFFWLLAWVLAPIAALPVFVRLDSTGREVYVPFWRWISTHDTQVDTYFWGTAGRTHWYLKRFTEKQFLANRWARYVNRVLWIYRNPAYWVKHYWLGFQASTSVVYMGPAWQGYVLVSANGDKTAFLYEHESNHLQIQLGWKLYRDDPDGRRMYAFRFKPSVKKRT